jgi:hypothetical protein
MMVRATDLMGLNPKLIPLFRFAQRLRPVKLATSTLVNCIQGFIKPLISKEIFETIQMMLRKYSGRSETLHTSFDRQYLLKGLVRCAYCGSIRDGVGISSYSCSRCR